MSDREFDGIGEADEQSTAATGADEVTRSPGGSPSPSPSPSPSRRKYEEREDATSHPRNISGARHQTREATGDENLHDIGSHPTLQDVPLESGAEEEEEDQEAEDDGTQGQYQLVTKSIYKPTKESLLQRLAGVAGGSRAKYAAPVSPPASIMRANSPQRQSQQGGADPRLTNLEDIPLDDSVAAIPTEIEVEEEDEGEPICVAIDGSGDQMPAFSQPQMHRPVTEDSTPQVVIHSGESDSETGFATLNPVIASKLRIKSPNSALAAADASPFLIEIPVASEVGDLGSNDAGRSALLLVVNALGASGLAKVEKFGTQSTLLELHLCSLDGAVGQHIMRTGLHKKGGSEAQWNQQFTTALESKHTQFLRVVVKTNNRMVVGEADVPLDKVGDLFYDQHFDLFRVEDGGGSEESTSLSSGGVDDHHHERQAVPAGQVHLQLKILDKATMASTAIPRLHLPFPSAVEPNRPVPRQEMMPIPAVLATGSLFYKVPFHNNNVIGYTAAPRRQWVAVITNGDPPELLITWTDPTSKSTFTSGDKKKRSLSLALVTEVCEGHSTKAFEVHKASGVVKEATKCFSLVTKTRSLDLVAASKEEAKVWTASLRELLRMSTPNGDDSIASARTICDYRQSALSSRPDSSVPQVTDTKGAAVSRKKQLAVWRSQVFQLARRGMVDDIASCLHDGCPVDLPETGTGDTLLILACRLGDAPLVELCLAWRAKNDPHPEFGDTALQVAVAAQHADCLQLLLSTAARSDMDTEIVNHIDSSNEAPLHVAARQGDLNCLQLLLHHGADICVVDEVGRTPLHCAVAHGGVDCVAYLLDVGGDSVLNLGDSDGDTALHYAALSGNATIAKLLLESAANVFAVNTQHESPYDVAVRERQHACAELIRPYCFPTIAPDYEDTASAVSRQKHIERADGDDSFQRHRRAQPDETYWRQDQGNHGFAHTAVASGRHTVEIARFDYPTPSQAWSSNGEPYVARSSGYDEVQHQELGYQVRSSTLSASEQVRAALARRHRASSMVVGQSLSARRFDEPFNARQLPLTSSPGTAREWSSSSHHGESSTAGWYAGASGASTERFDRNVATSWMNEQSMNYRGEYPQSYPNEHHRGRSYSEAGLRRNTEAPASSWNVGAQNDNDNLSAGMARVPASDGRLGWMNQSVSEWQRPTTAPATSAVWDLLYTQEGYPYYVNRETGVSQWEKPVESEPAHQYRPTTVANSARGPDEIIRMRLAQARKQNSVAGMDRSRFSAANIKTAEQRVPSSADSPEPTDVESTPESAVGSPMIAQSDYVPPSTLPVDEQQPSGSASTTEISSTPAETAATIAPTLSVSSTYESRTGLKLSVDVKSPPSTDRKAKYLGHCFQHKTNCTFISVGPRPVFVPSPRAKPSMSSCGDQASVNEVQDGSFEKVCSPSPITPNSRI